MAVFIGIALAATAAAGCTLLTGTSSNGPNPQGLELTHLTIGANPAVTSAALYLAQDKGYFAKQGLQVTIKPTAGGSTAVPQLLGGDFNIVTTNDVTAIAAQVSHIGDLRFLADAGDAAPNTFVLRCLPAMSARFSGARDLAGKTVSVSSRNDIVQLALLQLLDAADVPVADVQFSQVSYGDSGQELTTGQVQLAAQTSPYISRTARLAGAVTCLDPFGQGSPTAGIPIASYVSTATFAKKYPKTARAFQTAIAMGSEEASRDRQAVEAALVKYAKTTTGQGAITAQDAATITLPVFQPTLIVVNYKRVTRLMFKYYHPDGDIGHPDANFNVASMILTSPPIPPLPGS